jgi:hypothetical protein
MRGEEIELQLDLSGIVTRFSSGDDLPGGQVQLISRVQAIKLIYRGLKNCACRALGGNESFVEGRARAAPASASDAERAVPLAAAGRLRRGGIRLVPSLGATHSFA